MFEPTSLHHIHTLIWLWCSAPAHLCECLWSGSLRHGTKQWSPLWTPASRSEWTSHDPRGQSQTCSWCWTSCPWWPGSDPPWSSPGVGLEVREIGGYIHPFTTSRGAFYSSHASVSWCPLPDLIPSGVIKRKTRWKLNPSDWLGDGNVGTTWRFTKQQIRNYWVTTHVAAEWPELCLFHNHKGAKCLNFIR